MQPKLDLPKPDAEQLAQSEALVSVLRTRMHDENRHLSFAEFMQAALYEPGYGYYVAGQTVFGAAGDFQTAPMYGSLYASCLARQCLEVLRALPESSQPHALFEFGAGLGDLAAVLYEEICHLCEADGLALPSYHILEPSSSLRSRQQQRLSAILERPGADIKWHDSMPAAFNGIVIANEVLDAMPVERFRWQPGSGSQPLLREFVEYRDGALGSYFAACEPSLAAAVSAQLAEVLLTLPKGYIFEWNSYLSGWLQSVSDVLLTGAVLLIDYGYPRSELMLPEREEGTLMCYLRHHAHADPLVYPGIQDITAHVDFTAVAESAVAAGFELNGYCTQAAFLTGNHLLEIAADRAAGLSTLDSLKQAQELKTLTLPGSMGERFQVMGLSRGLEFALQGFAAGDQSHRL